MRFLGIDYGHKRIGLAISDPSAALAFPYEVLQVNDTTPGRIADICKKELVNGIVMGESKNFKGQENTIMKEARLFAEMLKVLTDLPVSFEPEIMSTIQAERLQGRADQQKKTIDASAAAVVLQSFLDRHMMGNGADMAIEED
ncbi:MAG: Holliday junction resolvase RuvX [Patescibacteria group bacterium]